LHNKFQGIFLKGNLWIFLIAIKVSEVLKDLGKIRITEGKIFEFEFV